jgi:hypothetical protein
MNRAIFAAGVLLLFTAVSARADPLCDGLIHVASAIPVDFKTLATDGELPYPTLEGKVDYDLSGAVLQRFNDGTSSPPCDIAQTIDFNADLPEPSGHYIYSCTLASDADSLASTDTVASRVAACLTAPLPAPVPAGTDNEHGLRIYEIESRGVEYTVSEDRLDVSGTAVPYVEIKIEAVTH